MPVFDDFIPEELETPNRELTARLEQFYQHPAIVEEAISQVEQKRILIEARASLLHSDPARKKYEDTSLVAALADNERDFPIQSPTRPTSKRNLSRTVRLFNAIAAILVVAVLISGSLALFAAHRSTNVGNNHPLASTVPCLPANTIAGVGLDYICAQHLYQDLHIVQTEGKYRITLTKGYADQGQVLVWYQIEQQVNGQYQLLKASDVSLGGGGGQMLATPDRALLGMGPLNWPGITGWSASPPSWKVLNKGTAQTTEVQMDVAGITLLSPQITNITWPTIHHFAFTLPVHGDWHSVSLRQTQIANGHSLTLTSVGYSLSLIDIFLKSPEPSFSNTYNAPVRPYGPPIVTSFKVDNVECVLNPESHFYQGADADQAYKGIQVSGPNGEFWQNLNCSLAGAGVVPHSEVTLVISMYDTAALHNTTLPASAVWTFHFQLP